MNPGTCRFVSRSAKRFSDDPACSNDAQNSAEATNRTRIALACYRRFNNPYLGADSFVISRRIIEFVTVSNRNGASAAWIAVVLELCMMTSMRCPTCAALNRDHGRECEVEARAVLDQQQAGADTQPREAALRSRKRQMAILSTLHHHRVEDHAA